MRLDTRIKGMEILFDELMSTTSLNEKREIVSSMPAEFKDDFNFCLEVLAGMHKLGYTYYPVTARADIQYDNQDATIEQLYYWLDTPRRTGDLSRENIEYFVKRTQRWAGFLGPLCNREYKLGIGKSLLEKSNLSPMLAKRYEGKLTFNSIFVTEKLDGNRCIAYWDGTWHFQSRNGKPMHVNFDMSDMPVNYIYDGEVLSPEQVELSDAIYHKVKEGIDSDRVASTFNSTSGLINRHTLNKKLVYNIFDIIEPTIEYSRRRKILENIQLNRKLGDDIRILPVLMGFVSIDKMAAYEILFDILCKVTELGGEGIMINAGGAPYINKRTDQLLKFKQVQTVDLEVKGIYGGTGKYEGVVGGLSCGASLSNGMIISVNVGAGLSDEQRVTWQYHPEQIIGKIVEVEYFDLSQSRDAVKSNVYSLRFPRLKKVRVDKIGTSEY